MAGELILIVDDNATNLKLMRYLLTVNGYEVCVAEDARGAQEALETRSPRLILMDIELPDMDGLTLTRRLREDPATRDIVIVAVTAYAMKSDRTRALAAGCDDYIAKPINTRELPAMVARYLERGRNKGGA